MAEARRSRKPRRTRPVARQDAAQREGAPLEEVGPAGDETASERDAFERRLGRAFAFGLPALGIAAAVVVASIGGLGPALLVLAGTALFGTIGFFWASIRTLSGEAPLPEGMVTTATWFKAAPSERKREVLRALKDLELEHSMGKIDDDDYRELSERYRETAKKLMREIDAGLAPRRERAESLAATYLQRRGLGAGAATDVANASGKAAAGEAAPPPPATKAPTVDERVPCASCGTPNELDAAFCKKCGSGLVSSTTDNLDASA